MKTNNIQIAAFSGSLRQYSLNRQLIQIASSLLPENSTMEIVDLADIPMYNHDLEKTGFPQAVSEFRFRLHKADAMVIATPEYNYSIPGVLKNALDWASRSQDGKPGPLNGKPLAIMGAGGRAGTARAQNHLRQIASHLNMYAINKPEVLVSSYPNPVFDENGNLTDVVAVRLISQLLDNLVSFTRKVNSENFVKLNMN